MELCTQVHLRPSTHVLCQIVNSPRPLHVGEMDEVLKGEAGHDVNAAWRDALVMVYTPCIESGVIYDLDRPFFRVCGYASANSTLPASFLQMLHRARVDSDSRITLILTTPAST